MTGGEVVKGTGGSVTGGEVVNGTGGCDWWGGS